MVSQERIHRSAAAQKEAAAEEQARKLAEEDAVRQAQEQAGVDLSATDDLLDEIDSLLEENAEAFVADYVQRGGE